MDFGTDSYFMKLAYKQAIEAFHRDEIPVGAIVVSSGQIIAKAYNQTELLCDVTAHAEIIALTSASNHLGAKYLDECDVYVTLEPCLMCAGALSWARPKRLIYGASDEKRGFMNYGKEVLHKSTILEMGILQEECSSLLQQFFIEKRKKALRKK